MFLEAGPLPSAILGHQPVCVSRMVGTAYGRGTSTFTHFTVITPGASSGNEEGFRASYMIRGRHE
jgi:hypothetical protein